MDKIIRTAKRAKKFKLAETGKEAKIDNLAIWPKNTETKKPDELAK